MLALPVATAASGFLPSAVMMFISWAFMTCTALLILEAHLWMGSEAHAMTMAGRFLGRWGKAISAVLYLFMAYFSLVAYIAGSGTLIGQFLGTHPWAGPIGVAVLLGLVIRMGHSAVGRVNTLLVVGMAVAYFLLVGGGISSIDTTLLVRHSWTPVLWGLPLMLTMFSFQTIVPSLGPMVQRHPRALRASIIGGTTLALLIYLVWQWIIMGTVPLEGPHGLSAALNSGLPATSSLAHYAGYKWIAGAGHLFALFALTTSFLGIGLGLRDFLADGFKLKRKTLLTTLVVVPSLIAALASPQLFYWALDATGGFGDAILNGMIPIAMVYIGRYRHKLTGAHQVRGGKAALAALATWSLVVLSVEIAQHF
jgi:tyrosine-specific transport protein